jgi:hypothetical protein
VTLDFQYNVTGKLETLTKRVSNHMLIPWQGWRGMAGGIPPVSHTPMRSLTWRVTRYVALPYGKRSENS